VPVADQFWQPIFRGCADDMLFCASACPLEKAVTERLFQRLPATRCTALIVNKPGKPKSRHCQRLQQSEYGIIALSVTNPDAVVQRVRGKGFFKQEFQEADLGRPFADHRKPRQKSL